MAKTAEYGLGEFTFPRGWFVIAESAKVNTVPMSIRYFGNDMVLYRGQSGKAHLLDAYCPHMGTHLGANTTSYVVRDHQHVQGDSIRCPYHAWRFGPDGHVDDIPYFKGPYPKAACVRVWKIQEKYGMVWVWHDAEGGEPNYDLPELEEWNDPQWVRWRIDDLGTLNSHPQEFVDNICDYSHLDPIHGSTVEYFQNEFTDHVAIQRQGGGHRTLTDKKHILETYTWYTGPSFLLSRMTGGEESIMMITHTPIDDGVSRVWFGLLVKTNSKVATDSDIAIARAYQDTSLAAFAQDFEVWSTKKPALQVMQLPTDGPFGKARTWYKQFYNARAKAKEYQDKVRGVHTIPGVAHAPDLKQAS
jgi:3-ketosteroid 9alpha-monooxygenase subunit A